MRAFLAVVPPPEALAPLAEVVGPLRAAYPSLGWVAPERWHVTLAFLGEISEGQAGRLSMAAAARRLRVSGGGAFPGEERPRVLWAGVDGELADLARAARTTARSVGVAVERRPFRPHLTLARVRAAFGSGPEVVAALRGVSGPEWTAAEVVLLSSRLGPRPVYEPVRIWTLRGS